MIRHRNGTRYPFEEAESRPRSGPGTLTNVPAYKVGTGDFSNIRVIVARGGTGRGSGVRTESVGEEGLKLLVDISSREQAR